MKPITNPEQLERLYRKAEQVYDFQREIINPAWQAQHDWVVAPIMECFTEYELAHIPIALQALSISSCFAVCVSCDHKKAYLVDATNKDLWEFENEFAITGDGLLFDEQLQFAIFREFGGDYGLIAGPKAFVEQALDASLDTIARDYFLIKNTIGSTSSTHPIWAYLSQLAKAHLAPDEEIQMRSISQLPQAIHDLSDLLVRENKLPLNWLRARGWKALPVYSISINWLDASWMARAISENCDTCFLYFLDSGEKYELTPTRDTLFHVFNTFASQFFIITDAAIQFVLWHKEHYSVVAGQEQWIIRFMNYIKSLQHFFHSYFEATKPDKQEMDEKTYAELMAIAEYYKRLLD